MTFAGRTGNLRERRCGVERELSEPERISEFAGPSRRVAILVVGMHRSGTSALTRVMNMLGCDLPATPLGAGKSNPTGHWESEPICRLNDRLLESAGTRWDDWQAFNSGWLRSPKAAQFRDEAVEVLGQEFGKSYLFVLKDPRLCRILPFWRDVLQTAAIQPLVLLPLRNPLEVAASLEHRNGFDPAFGMLLWLRHALDAEANSRGMPRLFTTYESLLAGWSTIATRAQDRLGIAWPRMTDTAAAEIQGFLQNAHRHHQKPDEAVTQDPTLGRWLRDSFGVLGRWAEGGENGDDFATLDRIRDEFNAAAPMFARLIASGQTAVQETRKLKQDADKTAEQLKAAEAAQKEALARSAATEAKLSTELANASRLATELKAAQQQTAATKKRIEELQAEAAQHVRATDAAKAALAAVRQQKAEATQRLTDLENRQGFQSEAVVRAEAALAQTQDRLKQALEAETSVKRHLTAKDGRIASLQAEVERQAMAAEVARAALTTERNAAGRMQAEVSAARRQAADMARQVALLEAEQADQLAATARAEAALVDARDRLAQTESALAQRRHEADQTAEELAAARTELSRLASEREQQQRTISGLKEHVEFLLGETKRHGDAMMAAQQRHQEALRLKDETLAAADKRNAEAKRIATDSQARLEKAESASAKAKAEHEAEVKKARMESEALAAERRRLEHRLKERFDEIATLTRMVRAGEDAKNRLRQEAAMELGAAIAALSEGGRLESLLPRRLRERYRRARLIRSGLIDTEWYREHYKDVGSAGADPIDHYLRHGHREARLPNPKLAPTPSRPAEAEKPNPEK